MLTKSLGRISIWSRIKTVPAEYPFAFGVVISGFKTSFSDLLVQKVVERKENIDWRRNLAFASFGFIYLGGVQYTIYVPIFGRLFPGTAKFIAKPFREKLKDTKGLLGTFGQVFIDQCVHHPLMYFPAFYCTKELVMADKPDLMRVLSDYRKNMKEDLLALWKIWVPGTLLNFMFMPMHLRIPTVAGISLVWTCILSAMRGGDVAHGEEMAGGAVTGATYFLLKEGLDEHYNTSPVELDPSLHHISISATGKQRPGLVAMFCRHISNEGGNVTHSKMVRLGQEFIMQMHVAVPPEKQQALLNSFNSSEMLKRELAIQVTHLSKRPEERERARLGMKIHCVGQDRLGMIASVAEKVASKDMSIENLATELRTRRTLDGNRREFVVDAYVSSKTHHTPEDAAMLAHELGSLKEDLNLDILDIRMQTDKNN